MTHELEKLKLNIENPGGNAWRRLRIWAVTLLQQQQQLYVETCKRMWCPYL